MSALAAGALLSSGCWSSVAADDTGADDAPVESLGDGREEDGPLEDGGSDEGRDVPLCPADGDASPECADAGWMLAMGGDWSDRFLSIVGLADGGAAAVGFTGVLSETTDDPWLVRFDRNGAIVWQERLPMSSDDARLSRIEEAADGDLLAFGTALFGGAPPDQPEALLTRFAPNGRVRWVRAYSSLLPEVGFSFVRMPAGGVLLAASAVTTDFAGLGVEIPWISRVGEDGEIDWQWLLCHPDSVRTTSIAATRDGGAILGGGIRAIYISDFSTPWIARLDAAGYPLWERSYGPGGGPASVRQVQELAGGDIVVLASARGSVHILRLDPAGDLVDARAFTVASTCEGCRLYETYAPTANGFLVGGARTIASGEPPAEIEVPLLASLDIDAGVVWGRQLGCGESLDGLAALGDGRILVAGADAPGSDRAGMTDALAGNLGPDGAGPNGCVGVPARVVEEVTAFAWTVTAIDSDVDPAIGLPGTFEGVGRVPTTAEIWWRYP